MTPEPWPNMCVALMTDLTDMTPEQWSNCVWHHDTNHELFQWRTVFHLLNFYCSNNNFAITNLSFLLMLFSYMAYYEKKCDHISVENMWIFDGTWWSKRKQLCSYYMVINT